MNIFILSVILLVINLFLNGSGVLRDNSKNDYNVAKTKRIDKKSALIVLMILCISMLLLRVGFLCLCNIMIIDSLYFTIFTGISIYISIYITLRQYFYTKRLIINPPDIYFKPSRHLRFLVGLLCIQNIWFFWLI